MLRCCFDETEATSPVAWCFGDRRGRVLLSPYYTPQTAIVWNLSLRSFFRDIRAVGSSCRNAWFLAIRCLSFLSSCRHDHCRFCCIPPNISNLDYSLNMACSWSPPVSYETRPVVVLGRGVLGRRIGELLPRVRFMFLNLTVL